ncbi:hypothetical protein EW026_g2390 [Hermanssonia centrifuga]|uniref:Cupin type-1 domain-containing protein n=1 Tax=Hermanssonia centrifuga TaxID=98765 RepID=A0A4S4KNH4_9APHY|nr:hypothetical protein EW026_g2390 [Hermanssonia centrifuga]
MRSAISSIAFAMAIGTQVLAQTEAEQVASLRAAASNVDRIKLLQDNEFVFDFLHAAVGETTGAGGHTVAASSTTFPALIGNGMAMTIGFLGPCGYNTPHTHPRATEFNFAVNGTLQTGFLAENGARFVFNEVPPGSAAIFPKGAIHFEMNNGCEDMLFVAAFSDEDPGVDQIAQRFFGLPPSFIAASLGNIGVEEVAGLEAMIPDNIALGTDECLQRVCCTVSCTGSYEHARRLCKCIGCNGAPYSVPSSSGAYVRSTVYSTSQTSTSDHSVSGGISNGGVSITNSDGKPNALILSLIVVVGVLAAGYVALAVMYFYRRHQEKKSRMKGSKYFQTGSDFAPQGAIFEAEKAQPFEAYEGSSEARSTPYDPPSHS